MRIHDLQKGFKKKICSNRNCMACYADPPFLNGKIVKNLNTTFCKVPPQDATLEILKTRTKKKKGGKVEEEKTLAKEK